MSVSRRRARSGSAFAHRRVHRHCELLRHGLGGDLDRHRRRPPHRRRARRLGARVVVAGDLLRGSSDLRQVLGAADRAADRDPQFVCSIGNVPLAAVLWNGGISFGGVLAFIFADLIVLRSSTSTASTTAGGWPVPPRHLLRHDGRRRADRRVPLPGLGLVPTERDAKVVEASVTWNYTTVLNIVFLGLAAVLVWRYFARRRGRDAADDGEADGRTTITANEHGHSHAG